MSRDKQIEEMANIIALKAFEQAHYVDGDENLADIVATELYEKDYRKASELAEEIFAEIERAFFEYYDAKVTYGSPTLPYHMREAVGFSLNELFMQIADLKKKYTESEVGK